jgi:hypothetical protein
MHQIHMKVYSFCILSLLFAKLCPAQRMPELSSFPANHSYSVSLNASLQGDTLLRSLMSNKILFVFGEGGRHDLELNNQVRMSAPTSSLRINYYGPF